MEDEPKRIQNRQFADHRGAFIPTPFHTAWLQQNLSYNSQGVFRGMHFQIGKYAQAKWVRVLQGAVVDLMLDLRNPDTNPNYLSVHTYYLTHHPHLNQIETLYVPKGFAHGFLTLQDHTIFEYFVDKDYAPDAERSIHWKSLSIFPEILSQYALSETDLIISEKDQNAPFLDQWRSYEEPVLPHSQ